MPFLSYGTHEQIDNGLPYFPSAKVNTGPGIQMEQLPAKA